MEDLKYCTKCGDKNSIDAIYCQKCGSKLIKNISNENKDIVNYNESIPPWKFALFSIISSGLYYVYWMYKSWKILRYKNNIDVSPFWRAIFSPIFVGSLARESFELAEQKGNPKNDDYFIIGAIFFISNLFDIGFSRALFSQNVSSPYNLIVYAPLLVKIGILIPIVKSMNYVWATDYPNLPEKKLTWWQIILIVIVSILSILLMLS